MFPYAKLYEGFLKQLFLDLGIIDKREYVSDRYRIGKALSPNLARRLGPRSAFGQMAHRFGEAHAVRLWQAWKNGRNLVFHYFPHNYRALSHERAREVIALLVDTMNATVEQTGVTPKERER